MNPNDKMDFLTIAIPTFNRAKKIQRLLQNIETNILASHLKEKITVFISDNASTDNTKEIVSSFNPKNFNLKYVCQGKNIGGEPNFTFLYHHVESQYIWFMGDDDLLLPGAIGKVYKALETFKPDALLFSFIQPPSSKIKTFDFPEDIATFHEPKIITELLGRYPKMSIYVLKKVEFSLEEIKRTEEISLTTGYSFIDMAYTVMAHSQTPKLCIISEPLATCDEDYMKIYATPEIWNGLWKVFLNPFVVKHSPHLARSRQRESYYTLISVLFAIKIGKYLIDDYGGEYLPPGHADMRCYDKSIHELDWRMDWLVKAPKQFIKFILLKTRLTFLYFIYEKIKKYIN